MRSHRTQASKSGLHSLNNAKTSAMSHWRALLQSFLQSASEYMNVTASTTTITFRLLIVPQQLNFFFRSTFEQSLGKSRLKWGKKNPLNGSVLIIPMLQHHWLYSLFLFTCSCCTPFHTIFWNVPKYIIVKIKFVFSKWYVPQVRKHAEACALWDSQMQGLLKITNYLSLFTFLRLWSSLPSPWWWVELLCVPYPWQPSGDKWQTALLAWAFDKRWWKP